MLITVLGGSGAWPTAEAACSGYLVEEGGFRLLVDPGYAALPALLRRMPAEQVDAVLVSHGHPDHCADLNPLLRARALSASPPPALPVYALPSSVDAVLALDRPSTIGGSYQLVDFAAGEEFEIGPFQVATWALPHFVPNAGLRLSCGGRVLAYTGDTGPSPDIVRLAADADVLLAEATFVEQATMRDAQLLSTTARVSDYANRAGIGRLLLTHLWPDTDQATAIEATQRGFAGPTEVAVPGRTVWLPGH